MTFTQSDSIKIATGADLQQILATGKTAFVDEPPETPEGLRFLMPKTLGI